MVRLRALLDLLRGERRHENVPVQVDRRKKRVSMKDAEKSLHDSIDQLERTVRMKREDFFKREVANDIQQTVQFATFSAICSFKVDVGDHRICRHPSRATANAICDEEACPIMRGAAIKAIA